MIKGGKKMTALERLYEEQETVRMHYVGTVINGGRYDFAFVYTSKFFGKTLTICMQTGRSTLLEPDDLNNIEHFCKLFNWCNKEDFEYIATFLKSKLPTLPHIVQY